MPKASLPTRSLGIRLCAPDYIWLLLKKLLCRGPSPRRSGNSKQCNVNTQKGTLSANRREGLAERSDEIRAIQIDIALFPEIFIQIVELPFGFTRLGLVVHGFGEPVRAAIFDELPPWALGAKKRRRRPCCPVS